VLFADAVHPTHAVRPVGCWAPKDTPIAVTQTRARQRLNVHGAIDLESGNTRMLEVATVNAISTIMLLVAIDAMYPGQRMIPLFLDNARYHHAKLVQAWLARPECRIKLRFIPAYCPHLGSIERLWGLMHKHITQNRCYETFADFSAAILTFLREEVPRNRPIYRDSATDNFRIIPYRHLFEYCDRKDLQKCVERRLQPEPLSDDGDQHVDRHAIQICVFTAFSEVP